MIRRITFVVLALGAFACTARYVREVSPAPIEASAARIERGRYLVDHVAARGACHTSRPEGDMLLPPRHDGYLAGGNWMQDGKLAVWMPNLTADVETGLGAWSDDEIVRAIRDGVGRDGSFLLPVMPWGSYRHLSD